MKINFKKYTILILIVLTLLGGFLRFYNLSNNPPGLTVDEVSTGYNIYSILKTGRDEYGFFLPIAFKSLGDYKPPFYIYASTIPVAIFGLNEFSVRFLSAFIGTLTIPLSFLLFRKITQKKEIALIGAFLFAISPWHIYYSRLAFEAPIATTFVMLAVFGFLKMLEGGYRWGILSALSFLISMYTYHSERVFVPLFIIFLIIIYRKFLFKKRNFLILFFSCCVLLGLPLLFSLLFGQAGTRAGMTLITNDPNFNRNVLGQAIQINNGFGQVIIETLGNKYLLLIFFIINKLITFLQPSFLFFTGLNMTQIGSFGLGLMYFFEIPTFIAGIVYYLQKKLLQSKLIFGWIILGLIPAAITLDDLNPIRTLLVAPMIILLSATGLIVLLQLLQKIRMKFKTLLLVFCLGFIVWNFIYAFLIFTIHFPIEKNEDFLYGSKESVIFALSQKNNYQEIILSPMRGTIGPDVRSVPHLYILFYSQYDPKLYQKINKIDNSDAYSFDTFTVRQIDWIKDKNKKGVLFIGSPWDFNDPNIKDEQIKKRFYLLDGSLILMAVSP